MTVLQVAVDRVRVGRYEVDIGGLVVRGEPSTKPMDLWSIELAMEYILEQTRVTKKYNISSYGWKHIVERHIERYLSNGEFIVAASLTGMKQRQTYHGSLNTELRIAKKVR